MHFIIALIKKKIASSLLIMRALGYSGIPQPNAQISSFNSPWKYRATEQMPKEREKLDVLLVGPENSMNTNNGSNCCTAVSVDS